MLVASTILVSCSKNDDATVPVTESKQYPIYLTSNSMVRVGTVSIIKSGDLGAGATIQLNEGSGIPTGSNAYITTTGREGEENILYASLNDINSSGQSDTNPVYLASTTTIVSYDDLITRTSLTLVVANQNNILATSNLSK